MRGLRLDVDNTSRKAIGSDGRFAIRNGAMKLTGGTLDYKVDSRFGKADGSKSLDGLETDIENDFVTVSGKAGSRTISVPVEVRYQRNLSNGASAVFTLKGTIVGHETATMTPQAVRFSTAPISTKHRDEAADVLATL